MRLISIPPRASLATILLGCCVGLLCGRLGAQGTPDSVAEGVLTEFASAIAKAGATLETDFGYCGSKTTGTAMAILVERETAVSTYLLLQPLTCGDRVGAHARAKEGKILLNLVTRDDLGAFLDRVAGVVHVSVDTAGVEEGPEPVLAAADQPFPEEESALTKAAGQMGRLDTIQAKRTRNDITYHTDPQSVTCYYMNDRGAIRHYVLTTELIGSSRSGKPYVNVYLRGFEMIGGTFTEDGAIRSQMIKSNPWKHLEAPPSAKDFRKDTAPASAKAKAPVYAISRKQEASLVEAAWKALPSEIEADRLPGSQDQLVIGGVTDDPDGEHFGYCLASGKGNAPGEAGLILVRASLGAGDSVEVERIKEVPQLALDCSILMKSRPSPASAASSRPETEESATPVTFTIPTGSDEGAETAMRSVALQKFNADEGMKALLVEVAGQGGTTGKAHALTIGRQYASPTSGSFYFLTTRMTSKLDKRNRLVPDDYMTHGRIYQFFFNGDEPKELPPSALKKVVMFGEVE